MLLVQVIDLYSVVVLGAVVVSWVGLPPTNPLVSFLSTLTEPLLAPLRNVLPDLGGLDFSPFVLLVGLRILRGLVLALAVA